MTKLHLELGVCDYILARKIYTNKKHRTIFRGRQYDVTLEFYNVMKDLLRAHKGQLKIGGIDCTYIITMTKEAEHGL